jgi:hypothetical protein
MTRGRLTSWFVQLAAAITRPFQAQDRVANATAPATIGCLAPASALQPVLQQPLARPLAAQLASQAKLNPKAGRKARTTAVVAAKTAKPKPRRATAPTSKRQSTARSVFLQARHKATIPAKQPSAAIIPLPAKPKSSRPIARAGTGRVVRFAA